jgi:hypothetical protein
LVDFPVQLRALLREIDSLSEERIGMLAANFEGAEASPARSTRRALARHLAMTPETPGVIGVLAGQLVLSEAMLSWEAVYDLDPETAYAARAAVLDMGLVLCVDSMASSGAAALAEPWVAAMEGRATG